MAETPTTPPYKQIRVEAEDKQAITLQVLKPGDDTIKVITTTPELRVKCNALSAAVLILNQPIP